VRDAGRLPANSQVPRPARQAIGRYIHFAVVGRANACIRLRINISLIIREIYKIEDFLTQFSPLYLPMKYLAIFSRHPIYTGCLLKWVGVTLRTENGSKGIKNSYTILRYSL